MTTDEQEQAPQTLLDVEPEEDAAAKLYYLTNRFNLLEILSAGFIGPRAMYGGKYYKDLLECCPGRIPLFTSPPGASVAGLVSEESELAYAVALEIPAANLGTGTGPDAGEPSEVSPNGGLLGCLVRSAPIPLALVAGVHFRSQPELDEYLARREQYSNVALDELPLTASPAFFEGEGADAGMLTGWLASLEPLASPDEETLRRADCLAGALYLVTRATPPERRAYDALAACLEAEGSADAKSPADYLAPLLPLVEIGEASSTGRAAEAVLFFWFAQVFAADNGRENSSSRLLLDEARAGLEALELQPAELEEVQAALDHIERLLLGERQFKPFTQGRGFSAAKSLCLALLRPDPVALLSWSAEETGADAEVLMQAAALSGLRVGAKSLPVDLRPQPLRAFVVGRQCRTLATAAREGAGTELRRLSVRETMDAEGAARLELLSVDTVLASAVRPAPTLLSLLRGADVATEPGRAAALLVSREMKWSDCLVTSVLFSRDSFSITEGKGRLHELKAVGEVKVSESVAVDAFEARLAEDPKFSRALEKKVRSMLRGEGLADAEAEGQR